jgi:hypothetical protein
VNDAVLRNGVLPAGSTYFAEIVSVEITDDVAVVKMVDDYFGSRFMDYLTMLKHVLAQPLPPAFMSIDTTQLNEMTIQNPVSS